MLIASLFCSFLYYIVVLLFVYLHPVLLLLLFVINAIGL